MAAAVGAEAAEEEECFMTLLMELLLDPQFQLLLDLVVPEASLRTPAAAMAPTLFSAR